MVRTRGLKTDYTPIRKIDEGSYIICWDYKEEKEPVYAELTAEEQAKIEAGEQVERTVIGEEDTDYCTYMYEELNGIYSSEYIKNMILKYFNNEIDKKILSGFVWNNKPVWLSEENQKNFSEAQRIAVMSNGANLPIVFKLGEDEHGDPIYHEFTSTEELTQFYLAAVAYIQQCLTEGWQKKDSIDWNDYDINKTEA